MPDKPRPALAEFDQALVDLRRLLRTGSTPGADLARVVSLPSPVVDDHPVAATDGAVAQTANTGTPRVPEAVDLALAAESVLQTFRAHRQVMLGSPDWTERDRAAFAVLERAVGRFWARDRGDA